MYITGWSYVQQVELWEWRDWNNEYKFIIQKFIPSTSKIDYSIERGNRNTVNDVNKKAVLKKDDPLEKGIWQRLQQRTVL